MSQEHVEAVAACIAAYNAGEWDRAAAVLAADVEWRDSSEHPDRKEVVGPDAVIEHLRARLNVVASTFEVDRVVDRGGKIVALGHLRAGGLSSEAEVRTPFALVLTFGAEDVVLVEEFRGAREALDAAGVEE
jgi:ketosteroid isomerase-like protein